MSNIVIAPSMTVKDLAELVEANKARDMDCYVRIESFGGKPIAFLVREDSSRNWIPPLIRRQAD